MKQGIVFAVLAVCMAGCAGNQATRSAESGTDGVQAKKKECSYERSSGGNSRLQRVCHYGDGE